MCHAARRGHVQGGGATFFRYGFVFAVGLTLLPVPLAFASWVIRLLGLLG